ncbi:MAG: ComF family protein, partial [Chromatiales bacterium]|nr:ComF family protein [Chromatiales bacterium]
VRATAPQSGLSARSRRRNVASGFCLDEARPPESLALVDDVMTTGSTLAAAAQACRRGGVRRIEVWVAARAELARSRS